MRIVFGLVLLAGLALAGFAVYMAQNYIGAYQSALEQERSKAIESVPVQEIYVATRAIDYGEQIMPEDMALMPWPKQTLPDTFFEPLFLFAARIQMRIESLVDLAKRHIQLWIIKGEYRPILLVSILVGLISLFTGLALSYTFDLPSGATIVLCACALFFICFSLSPMRRRKPVKGG